MEAKLAEAATVNSKTENIEPMLRGAIDKLTQLNKICLKSDSYKNRELIGSMYPQKFTFEELQHRTALTSKLYYCTYLINSELDGKKEGQATEFSCLPILAPQTGHSSNHLVEQLKLLNKLQVAKKGPISTRATESNGAEFSRSIWIANKVGLLSC